MQLGLSESKCQDYAFSGSTYAANCPLGDITSCLYSQYHIFSDLERCVDSVCEKTALAGENRCYKVCGSDKACEVQCKIDVLLEVRKCEGNDYCGYYGHIGVCLNGRTCTLVAPYKHQCS